MVVLENYIFVSWYIYIYIYSYDFFSLSFQSWNFKSKKLLKHTCLYNPCFGRATDLLTLHKWYCAKLVKLCLELSAITARQERIWSWELIIKLVPVVYENELISPIMRSYLIKPTSIRIAPTTVPPLNL